MHKPNRGRVANLRCGCYRVVCGGESVPVCNCSCMVVGAPTIPFGGWLIGGG